MYCAKVQSVLPRCESFNVACACAAGLLAWWVRRFCQRRADKKKQLLEKKSSAALPLKQQIELGSRVPPLQPVPLTVAVSTAAVHCPSATTGFQRPWSPQRPGGPGGLPRGLSDLPEPFTGVLRPPSCVQEPEERLPQDAEGRKLIRNGSRETPSTDAEGLPRTFSGSSGDTVGLASPVATSSGAVPVPLWPGARPRRFVSAFERAGMQLALPSSLHSALGEQSPGALSPLLLTQRDSRTCGSKEPNSVGSSLGSGIQRSFSLRQSGELAEPFGGDAGSGAGSGGLLRSSSRSGHWQAEQASDCGVPVLDFSELQLFQSIGRGSYGQVYLVRRRPHSTSQSKSMLKNMIVRHEPGY